jgi:hypothetical protein
MSSSTKKRSNQKPDATKPKVTTLDLALLADPEFILRVKRRVGPSLWEVVASVLACVKHAAQTPLDQPDPLAAETEGTPKPKNQARRR